MKITPKKLKSTSDVSRGYKDRKAQIKDFGLQILYLAGLLLATVFLISSFSHHIPDSFESVLKYKKPLPKEISVKYSAAVTKARGELDKLLQAGVKRTLEYELILIESDQPNAFALPGGYIGLTSGLLDLELSDASILFIIAHELGHHELKHISKKLSLNILFESLKIMVASAGDLDQAVKAGLSWFRLAHSRSEEIAADDYAADRLMLIYGNLEGADQFFRIMAKHDGGENDGNKWQSFFSTHPLTTDRIGRLKNKDAK